LPLEELDFAASAAGAACCAGAASAPRAACAVPLVGDGELAERGFNTTGALAAGVRTGKGPVSTLGISPLAAGRAVALRATACLAGDGERADAADATERAERAERAAVVAFLSSSYK